MENRKVKFTLGIGFAGEKREETFTLSQLGLEEGDYKSEEELNEILSDEWKNWSDEYIDGGFQLED